MYRFSVEFLKFTYEVEKAYWIYEYCTVCICVEQCLRVSWWPHERDESGRILPHIFISPNFTDCLKNQSLRTVIVEGSTPFCCASVYNESRAV